MTGLDFTLGAVASCLARHVDPAKRSLADIIVERLSRADPALPPNHDVEHACRQSLRQAIGLLAQTLDLHSTQPQTLVQAFKNRFDADGKWKPLIEWWHTDQREWFLCFLKAADSEESLARFPLPRLSGAPDLNKAIRSQDHPEWERHFNDSLRKWTELHTPFEKRPACFDSWLLEGWPLTQDECGKRITLYQAWSLFLQDHFKTDDKVRAILTADWLASIDERLRSAPLSAEALSAALAEPLGEQLAMLTELRDSARQMAAGLGGLEEQTGALLGLMLEFGADMAGFRREFRQSIQFGQATHAKLDASLENDGQILTLLKKLTETPAPSAPAATLPPAEKRIAHSELLAADGASRYERLVGRAREKTALTRAWRQPGVNVLVFVAWGGVGKTSLITDWISQLHAGGWQGVDAFFDWSFYSQGMSDQSSANSDLFFRTALHHFGEHELADSAASLEEKAARLAGAVCRQRTLLVLDGIEPLQHPRRPGHEEGRLKDGGILTLLRLLADSAFSGLCLVTTRVPVIDLTRYIGSTVRQWELNHLSVRHGAELLHLAGACYAGEAEIKPDDEELRAAAIEVKGHAMTLQMLGGYLASAHEGDIRRRGCVDFARVFEDQLEGHTFNVMAAYEEWFQAEGERGRRQLDVLRMLGLFDRAADADCIAALKKDGGIAGVSDAVAGLSEAEWRQTLHRLSEHRLAYSDRQTHALDAHPLIREYFARQLRERQPEAFQAAHSRLFEHLCQETQPHQPETLEGLQPLYQAVVHGCLAGRQQEACDKVYIARILRGTGSGGNYSTFKLGAIGADLGAVAAFFEQPWSRLSPNLTEVWQAWLLNQAAFSLRALGRLTEAREPMGVSLKMCEQMKDWKQAAIRASNLSELEVTLGLLGEAVATGRRAIGFADQSGDWVEIRDEKTTAADALHQSGQREEAEALFVKAETLQRERQPQFPLLYSLQGFQYCDLILAEAERAAWLATLDCGSPAAAFPSQPCWRRTPQAPDSAPGPRGSDEAAAGVNPPPAAAAGLLAESGSRLPQSKAAAAALAEAERRATQTLEWGMKFGSLLTIALDHLTLARVALYRAVLGGAPASAYRNPHLPAALDGLRKAGQADELPKALLTAALHHHFLGDSAAARRCLDEARQIAERGPMPLFLADVHLHRARLFRDKAALAQARALIEHHGYSRRAEELAEAEAASGTW